MAIYVYKAKNGPTDVIEGRIEASSEKEAIEKISGKGFIPLKIVTEAEGSAAGLRETPAEGRAVRTREITLFTRQLASLLKSGVPILKSLRIIAEQTQDREFRAMLKAVHKEIEEGAVLSAVLGRYPRVFSPLYIAMIRAGEDSGKLPQVLLKVAEYRVKQEELLSRFRAAMAYPALMAVVGAGTVIFMLAFVMPRLTRLYGDMGQGLPLPTKILIAVSGAIKHWGLAMLAAAVILAVLLIRYCRSGQGRYMVSRFLLSLPLVRSFVLKLELARFSRTMELLLRSGINILRALYITLPVIGNEVVKGELSKCYGDLEQGGSFGKSLKNSVLVPLFMSNLLIVGEESGKLDESLAELAESYERDTDETLRAMAGLIEPALILGMGLVVGFIVVAMLLPIFEINVMVH